MGWLAGWDKRVKVTIDSGDITAALVNFPVLLFLSAASGIDPDDITFIFDEVGANSLKIAVTENDGTTECKVEIEKWDLGNEEAWLWVKVPAIASAVDTDIYLYFDNDHADNVANVGIVGSAPGEAVWDASFECVLHLSEAAGNFLDSTNHDNDASAQGTVNRGNQKIDGGIDLPGTNDYVRIDTNGILDGFDEATIEAWVYLDALAADRAVLNDWGAGDDVVLLYYDLAPNNKWRTIFRNTVPAVGTVVFGTAAPSGAWYHVVTKYVRNDFVYGYENGVKTQGDAVANNPLTSPGNLFFAGINRDLAMDLNGKLDEIRLSSTGRSDAWIAASYESGDDDLVSYGTEELLGIAPQGSVVPKIMMLLAEVGN